MYKIYDRQNWGFLQNGTLEDEDNENFETLEECRQRLIGYHEIDWSAENDINSQTLADMCEYGDWEIQDLAGNEVVI